MPKILTPTKTSDIIYVSTESNTPVRTKKTRKLISESVFNDNNLVTSSFNFPELKIKKGYSSSKELSTLVKRKSSTLNVDLLSLQRNQSEYKGSKMYQKKTVSFQSDSFIEVIKIESFKRFNYVEEIKEKEYDGPKKQCCTVF